MELTNIKTFRTLIAAALAEDLIGPDGMEGDVTSSLLLPKGVQGKLQFNAREDMVACGLFLPGMVFEQLSPHITVELKAKEGAKVHAGTTLLVASGPAWMLLTGERVALNLMQRTCSIATLTKKFLEAVSGTKATILDTRKTMPGLRELDKYAVRTAGGMNHRMGLYDMVLIKDNHIALAGGVTKAVAAAREGTKLPVVVECDTIAQVEEAMAAKPDRILLDNMSTRMLKEAVAKAGGKIKLEASGGVTLTTVKAIADTGVDCISVGALTHSVPSVDIGADIEIPG